MAREDIRRRLEYWGWQDVNASERQEAQEAAARAMARLPVGTPRETLDKAVLAATEPIMGQAKERKETEWRTSKSRLIVDSKLRHVDEYVRRQYEFGSQQELAAAVRDLKADIRDELVELLAEEDLSTEATNAWIEDAVDELLH